MTPERADVDMTVGNETDRTYKMKERRIKDFAYGIEAIGQAVYKILMTQRYSYAIYDRNYGIELNDLIGADRHYVCAVLKGRVEDALLYDSRIKAIKNWALTVGKAYILAEFTVETELGDADISNRFDI